eukprot:m.765830 g.765830  ORF g.765830 m.765830 type:complete len:601 (-) comp59064_c0_seq20:278-2080(-)
MPAVGAAHDFRLYPLVNSLLVFSFRSCVLGGSFRRGLIGHQMPQHNRTHALRPASVRAEQLVLALQEMEREGAYASAVPGARGAASVFDDPLSTVDLSPFAPFAPSSAVQRPHVPQHMQPTSAMPDPAELFAARHFPRHSGSPLPHQTLLSTATADYSPFPQHSPQHQANAMASSMSTTDPVDPSRQFPFASASYTLLQAPTPPPGSSMPSDSSGARPDFFRSALDSMTAIAPDAWGPLRQDYTPGWSSSPSSSTLSLHNAPSGTSVTGLDWRARVPSNESAYSYQIQDIQRERSRSLTQQQQLPVSFDVSRPRSSSLRTTLMEPPSQSVAFNSTWSLGDLKSDTGSSYSLSDSTNFDGDDESRNWTICLRGLPAGMTEESLRLLGLSYGPVVAARITHDRKSGLASGVGYLGFPTEESARLALDRLAATAQFHVSWHRATRSQESDLSSQKEEPRVRDPTSLQIFNLPPTVDEAQLETMLQSYGKTLVCKFSSSGLNRQAFVRLDSLASCQRVINAWNGKQLFPQYEPLVVQFADVVMQLRAKQEEIRTDNVQKKLLLPSQHRPGVLWVRNTALEQMYQSQSTSQQQRQTMHPLGDLRE